MSKVIDPPCNMDKCFACENGHCRVLIDNDFRGRTCPFFKTKKQLKLEEKRRTLREEIFSDRCRNV